MFKTSLKDYFELIPSILKEFNDCFLKLKYYDYYLMNFLVDKQIIYLKNSIQNQMDLTFCSELVDTLLRSCVFFQHKRVDLLDCLFEAKIDDSRVIFNEEMPIEQFLIYSCLTNYEKYFEIIF